MYDLRRPCDSATECLHRICHACEQPIRSNKQKKDEHPGAKPGHIRNRLCDRCMIEGHPSIHDMPRPEPDPDPKVKECEKPSCWHRACVICETPLRPANQSAADHPGTRPHHARGHCRTCKNYDLPPDELQDQRHIILPDRDMDRMAALYPDEYAWHIRRRKRLRIGGHP